MKLHRTDGKYFEVETEDDLTLYIFQPAYKLIVCSDTSYIRNTLTGEDCGQEVVLCAHVNNIDGTTNDHPVLDPNTYEIVRRKKHND